MSDPEVMTEIVQDSAMPQPLAQAGMGNMLPAAAAARMAEVQVSANFAMQRPRSVARARQAIMETCKSLRFAENAGYSYVRAGTEITGPSIDLLKAIAIEWRNIQYGWEVVTTEGMFSTIRVWAWDVERNVPSSITFRVKHWIDTKGGGRACRDEREVYEVCANMASRRLRACLENVVPSYVVDEAFDACKATLAGSSDVPLHERIKKATDFGREIGVTVEMIEEKFNRGIDSLQPMDLARLGRMFNAIKSKTATVEEHFPPPAKKETEATPTDLAGVAEEMKKKSAKKDSKPKDALFDPEESRKLDAEVT